MVAYGARRLSVLRRFMQELGRPDMRRRLTLYRDKKEAINIARNPL